VALLFSRKEAKTLGLLRRRILATQNSAKRTQGVRGVPLANLYVKGFSSFPEKNQKGSASQTAMCYPTLGEDINTGGNLEESNNPFNRALLFPEKEAKSVELLLRR
jgi:hypothetical protein